MNEGAKKDERVSSLTLEAIGGGQEEDISKQPEKRRRCS